ncbi:NUDIX hydrolase [Alteromonas oceanisediminis]|uniref:NUDIX hydrolase n=1 Tax=Alteromonas oceanisediminis TaxID=2836180 RepID=UPI001BD9A378|nr:NUDIX hydrolase [Alteromonas oceanisediminis]MBT0585314.1 NUDIX hydrolase [Alteromonas oceanisediminis]
MEFRFVLSSRLRHSAILGVVLLGACSESSPANPTCRSSVTSPVPSGALAACVIVDRQHLLTIGHRLSGKLDLPGGTGSSEESAACTAHRETFEETGLNVEVTELIGTTDSGLWLFACQPSGGFGSADPMAVPPWALAEVSSVQWIDPFTLTHNDWRFADQHVVINDAFVAAGRTATGTAAPNPE